MPTDKVFSSMLPHHAEGVGVARKQTGDASVAEEQERIYSSRIIKAGALLADTTTLLANWSNTILRGSNARTFSARLLDLVSPMCLRFFDSDTYAKKKSLEP
jgi:hypothetical protein